jgi:hypothetical protein
VAAQLHAFPHACRWRRSALRQQRDACTCRCGLLAAEFTVPRGPLPMYSLAVVLIATECGTWGRKQARRARPRGQSRLWHRDIRRKADRASRPASSGEGQTSSTAGHPQRDTGGRLKLRGTRRSSRACHRLTPRNPETHSPFQNMAANRASRPSIPPGCPTLMHPIRCHATMDECHFCRPRGRQRRRRKHRRGSGGHAQAEYGRKSAV